MNRKQLSKEILQAPEDMQVYCEMARDMEIIQEGRNIIQLRGHEPDAIMQIGAITAFVKDALKLTKRQLQERGLDAALRNKLETVMHYRADSTALQYLARLQLNPYAWLFFYILRSRRFLGIECVPKSLDNWENKSRDQWYADFIGALQQEAQKDSFKKDVQRLKHTATEQANSMLSYVDALFRRYSRILVVRLDLGYRHGVSVLDDQDQPDGRSQSLPLVKDDMERLLNNRRMCKRIFSDMVGYIWKLEYGGRAKGLHYHCFFFFDGSKVREDITRGDMIGEYWRDKITCDDGVYYNCNAQIYIKRGVGMVEHDDKEKRKVLAKAILYLAKKEQCLRMAVPDVQGKHCRLFATGGKPKPAKRKGRPRKTENLLSTIVLSLRGSNLRYRPGRFSSQKKPSY